MHNESRADLENPAEYNGWANYPTWNIHLWISNEEGSYSYWRERAAHWRAEAEKAEYPAPRAWLADELKSEFSDAMPIEGASPYVDILGWALDVVDWREIATALLED